MPHLATRLANLFDSLFSAGVLIGVVVVALVLLGTVKLGRRATSKRAKRGEAFERGSGDGG